MDRRGFLSVAGVAAVAGLSGCSAVTGGGGGGGDDDEQIGHRITDDGSEGQYLMTRVDFIDQTGTLGQVDQVHNDVEADDLVNEYTEEDWERMDTNDLDRAKGILENNDSSIEEIRPWVEKALNRELEGTDLESNDSPPGPDEADERALMYGLGRGIQSETLVTNSIEAANTLKRLC